LLTRLQCLRLFIGRTLEVHAKPKNGDEDAGYAGGNVLRRLQALVARKLLDPGIVARYLGHNGSAVHELILRLNDGDRRRCSTCASGKCRGA
jgi:hypothetical protein